MQKVAGVKRIFDPTGFLRRSGVYSTGQPKNSPFHGLLIACKCWAKALTSAMSGMTTGRTVVLSSPPGTLALAVSTSFLLLIPYVQDEAYIVLNDALDLPQFDRLHSSWTSHTDWRKPE